MDKRKIILAFVLLLALGFLLDMTEEGILGRGNRIKRGDPGTGDQEVRLKLSAGDRDRQVLEDYDYELTLQEKKPDEKEKAALMERAKKEIDSSFCQKGQKLSHVTGRVDLRESYADGLVDASWSFSPGGLVDEKGMILEEHLKEKGILVGAYVQLSCFEAEEVYEFSFKVFPVKKPRDKQLVSDVNHVIAERQTEAGEDYLELPKEMNGVQLNWSEIKPHYFLKFLFLDVLLGVSLVISGRERARIARKKHMQQMQLDYPEIVSKLLILCGAGMSVKQAWHKISTSYIDKRQKITSGERAAYEEMVRTDREMADGVSERIAFRQFGERVPLACYHRLGRLLTESIQKGARGMDEQMRREAEDAFEARKQLARKLGEEAGTKMMLPMMLMLVIVIAIVMVPAVVSF